MRPLSPWSPDPVTPQHFKLDNDDPVGGAPTADHGARVQSRNSVITPNPTPSHTPLGSPTRPIQLVDVTQPLNLLNLDLFRDLQNVSLDESIDTEVFTTEPHNSGFLRSNSSNDTTAPQEDPDREDWLRSLVPGTRDAAYAEGSPLTQPHRRRSWTDPQNCPASGWWCSFLGAPELVMALRSISGSSLYSYGSSNEPHCGVLHATTHYQAGIGHIMSQNSQML